MKTEETSRKWRRGARWRLLFLAALATAPVAQSRVQAASVNLGLSDYRNVAYHPAPAVPGVTLTGTNLAVSIFGGNIGPTGVASTPNDGNLYLTRVSFGQPAAGDVFKVPDFQVGQEITVPPGASLAFAPEFDPSAKFFYVASAQKLFANEAGFATVIWKNASGVPVVTNRYFISGMPVKEPMAIYWTEDNSGVPTGAPTVDFSTGPGVVVHPNSAIPNPTAVWLAGNQLHATNYEGTIILEYTNRATGAFMGIELVEIRQFQADQVTQAGIGAFLAPNATVTNTARPYVSRGLSASPPYAYQIGYGPLDGQVFAVRPTSADDQIEVFWRRWGLQNLVWPYEMHRYTAVWPANFEELARRIYITHDAVGSVTKAPFVKMPEPPINVRIHYNTNITPAYMSMEPASRNLMASNLTGRVLIQYDTFPQTNVFALQLVDVRPYMPDFLTDDFIGAQLLPNATPSDKTTNIVSRGLAPDNYAYQHTVEGRMYSDVFAVRRTTSDTQIEVFFMRLGVLNVAWPYEMHRYRADWPVNDPARYNRYVRASSAPQGPVVDLPPEYSGTLMSFQEPASHAQQVSNNRFWTTSPGWSLLKYAPSNIVMFQVVRTVWHDDGAFFNLSQLPRDIGGEITDPYHQGPRPGYIYLPYGDRYDWEIYDGTTNDPPAFQTGQIFAVNKGPLEVWWYNMNQGVQWPSLVKRYIADWPGVVSDKIIIASQRGTGGIDGDTYRNFRFYYQNDPALPGFNPNDEHALMQLVDNGMGIFALRSDLGTPSTSEPFVLMKYRDAIDRWHYRLYRVLAEEAPYFFQYSGEAGKLIQPPFPLSTLAPLCEENAGVSGPYWRDRNLDYWAKSAGNNGGTAGIVMRYFYPVQPGFFFPGASPPGLGAHVPWLDLYAGSPTVPVNINYTVSWPADTPELRVGESLVKAKRGLPDIALQPSVQIIYQQSVAQGGGSSVKLIDPTLIREANLAQLPPEIRTANRAGKLYFIDLPPNLRSRVWYEGSPTFKLRLTGEFRETTGIEEPQGYLLLNVLTDRDYDSLIALSMNGTFRTAVGQLKAVAANVWEVAPNQPFNQPLALTAGLATGVGYVTLALNNNYTNPIPTGPVSLQIIKVSCPLYKGELKVLFSENPFDEKITLRHSGDFAGKADNYIFEWRTLPPGTDGLPQTGVAPENWLFYNPTPANGTGALDITIEGPGLFTLSDNYFLCRYRPAASGPCGTGWSAWTEPQLAEGWIKRVLAGINPFEQRFRDYENSTVNTIVNMISQAGPRWSGNVPLDPQAANSLGLIEIYETVLNRGIDLSIEGLPPVNYPPANDALLLVAGRISDLYMLLGNEAYADAADPTIGFGTSDPTYGSEASSIHCFQNQTASLLEEELDLLRGRDDRLLPGVKVYPYYNRLVWNFTGDINGGEVAYNLNYDIRDVNGDGTIDEADAQKIYPQGHGDAWGHYLSAIKGYYRLLRNTNFTWVPRIEAVLVGGMPVSVDFYDERKFAKAAAARARTGAEIVNQTYRSFYTESPSGQWQGYQDSNTNRAWGMAEWGSRAGQGAFFDWVVANAVLPEVSTNTGIQKVDRTSVTELRDIGAAFQDIQEQVDKADMGLNPLGLVRNVVPFDISPTDIDAGKTHFEQIYDRAVKGLNNAIAVFNHANNSTQILRRQADSIAEFQKNVTDREADFKNRLIEIFGYPYPEDIGASGTYPTGYEGPDLYHFSYVDSREWTAQVSQPTRMVAVLLSDPIVGADGSVTAAPKQVFFNVAENTREFVKPTSWTTRRAPGEIQRSLGDLILSRLRLEKALVEYDNLMSQIQDQADLLAATYAINANEIAVLNESRATQQSLNSQIYDCRNLQFYCRGYARAQLAMASAIAEFMPLTVGVAMDATSVVRGGALLSGSVMAAIFETSADSAGLDELDYQQAKEIAQADTNLRLTTLRQEQAVLQQIALLQQLVRQEASLRLELYNTVEASQQAAGNYRAALTRGQRLLEDRLRFRQQTAAQVQAYRYKDMAFRIFRNDALQKYRAQFDLAAMYVFLAAKAYDFETNLREGDSRKPGADFINNVVRSRTIGLIQGGQPMTGTGSGDAGLADPMARMFLNWDLVLKTQLGFNNPDTETGRFSLRQELFRVQTNATSRLASSTWREVLTRSIVSNLFDIPEFQRYCIPFSPSLPQEPGVVIRFGSTINFGENFFGWPAGGGDNSYDSSHFATKVRSVGVWFANYNNLGSGMINTPRVYLVPVGSDVMRSPTGNQGVTREWKIMDQLLPVPFPLSSTDLNNPGWIPLNDSLIGTLGEIRKFASFRAYHDSGSFTPAETINNSRLIGRSVWNTDWLLIIPAGTLHSDRAEGLQRFINGSLVNGVRDGNGVTDIKIFFQTYSYAGN
ncbi:MAG TPA: hypothetical protein VJA21_17305 [Verrucomicrobiae bacterium]